MRPVSSVVAAAVLPLWLAACSSAAEEPYGLGRKTVASQAGETIVTAESEFGHGTVSGPVRVGARGRLEVRLPGGTWIECARRCSDTLRRETVDFWENRDDRRNGNVDGPGYFRWKW